MGEKPPGRCQGSFRVCWSNTANRPPTIRTKWKSAPGFPQTPTADDILNRYIEAIGGAQRLAALTSYTGKGQYEGFDSYHGKVPVDLYAKATGERTVIAHTQNGDSINAYDAHNAWIEGPDKPVSVLQLVPGVAISRASSWIRLLPSPAS